MDFQQFTFVTLFFKGGPVMYPLLLLSVAGLGFIVERFIHYSKARINTESFLQEMTKVLKAKDLKKATELAENTRGPIASIMRAGLHKVDKGRVEVERAIELAGGLEMARLERGLLALSSISNLAPLLGFLGTVTGMINSFDAIAKQGLNDPGLVAGGISEALITTAAGLIVAIPVSAAFNYFTATVSRMVLEMEESSSILLDYID